MQTGIRILKIVGKAAARGPPSVIVWVAGKLERRN